jgi:3-isopropylmalate dehydratase
MQNGMLPVTLSEADCQTLVKDAEAGLELEADLEKQEIKRPNGSTIKFTIDPFRKHCLLNGLDNISLTLQKADAIDAFEEKRSGSWPWLDGFGYKAKKIPIPVSKVAKLDW